MLRRLRSSLTPFRGRARPLALPSIRTHTTVVYSTTRDDLTVHNRIRPSCQWLCRRCRRETGIFESTLSSATNQRGALAFALRKLYAAVCETPIPRTRFENNVLGKMLRINKNGKFRSKPFFATATGKLARSAPWDRTPSRSHSTPSAPSVHHAWARKVRGNQQRDPGANYGMPTTDWTVLPIHR